MNRNNSPLLHFIILDTSITALCGPTGVYWSANDIRCFKWLIIPFCPEPCPPCPGEASAPLLPFLRSFSLLPTKTTARRLVTTQPTLTMGLMRTLSRSSNGWPWSLWSIGLLTTTYWKLWMYIQVVPWCTHSFLGQDLHTQFISSIISTLYQPVLRQRPTLGYHFVDGFCKSSINPVGYHRNAHSTNHLQYLHEVPVKPIKPIISLWNPERLPIQLAKPSSRLVSLLHSSVNPNLPRTFQTYLRFVNSIQIYSHSLPSDKTQSGTPPPWAAVARPTSFWGRRSRFRAAAPWPRFKRCGSWLQ